MYDALHEPCDCVCSSVMSDDVPSWSSATMEIITAHMCTHNWMDQENKKTWLCKSKVKVDQSKMLKVKSVLTPVRTVRLHQLKNKKRGGLTSGSVSKWKSIKLLLTQPYRGHKLTQSPRGCATSPKVKPLSLESEPHLWVHRGWSDGGGNGQSPSKWILLIWHRLQLSATSRGQLGDALRCRWHEPRLCCSHSAVGLGTFRSGCCWWCP